VPLFEASLWALAQGHHRRHVDLVEGREQRGVLLCLEQPAGHRLPQRSSSARPLRRGGRCAGAGAGASTVGAGAAARGAGRACCASTARRHVFLESPGHPGRCPAPPRSAHQACSARTRAAPPASPDRISIRGRGATRRLMRRFRSPAPPPGSAPRLARFIRPITSPMRAISPRPFEDLRTTPAGDGGRHLEVDLVALDHDDGHRRRPDELTDLALEPVAERRPR
jgi:hypothetical protein